MQVVYPLGRIILSASYETLCPLKVSERHEKCLLFSSSARENLYLNFLAGENGQRHRRLTWEEIEWIRRWFFLYQVPGTFSEGGWAGKGQITLSLVREFILEGLWATSWPTARRFRKETVILLHNYFPWKDLHQERRGQVNKIVMDHFKSILLEKSGPANKQHTYRSIIDARGQTLRYGPQIGRHSERKCHVYYHF